MSENFINSLKPNLLQRQYDYIIAGAGASGLSLAWRLLQSPLADRNFLLVDSSLKASNDKTWCFWDKGAPPFSDIIHKSWNSIELGLAGGHFIQPLKDYSYYCIRSEDFYSKTLSAFESQPNVTLLEDDITGLSSAPGGAALHTDTTSYQAEYIFQSCFEPEEVKNSPPEYPLLQHFLGWEISSNTPVFDDSVFTLMDFDDTFEGGVAFIYLLPWSAESGLLEYTVFSQQQLEPEIYAEKISLYLNHRFDLKPIDYKIQRKETGTIPMQDRPDPGWYKPHIVNMGTKGGLTKPSTGYTFRRIQQHTESIVQKLVDHKEPVGNTLVSKRYKAYDLWLLQIIHDHPADAQKIFNQLFHNNSIDSIFRFLGEESSLLEDLKIMSSVPSFPFLRAIWQTMGRLREI